jgi:hypothetical protein
MSFWSWWSRKRAVAALDPLPPERKPTITDADRQYVRAGLDRFEACGLQIWSKLDRELIVVRALADTQRWGWGWNVEPPENGLLIDHDPIDDLFFALAGETDCWDEMEEQFTPLSAMDEDAAEAMLYEHCHSIFVNAESINTVNEGSFTFLVDLVQKFDALTNGALALNAVRQVIMKNGVIRVSFQVEGLGDCQCEVEDRKRPNVTPAFDEMNRIAQHKGLGRFLIAPEGNSEQETFIFATEDIVPKITSLLNILGFESPDTAASA